MIGQTNIADDKIPVLVVEDDNLVRRLLKRTLERHGYRAMVVDCAAKAREAWSARDGEFSLVISDVVMPGENGLLLCRALREDRPDLPILIITGFAPAEIVGEGGTIDYPVLPKPFTTAQLVAKIRELLG
ncbi:MAG: response regulator [Deltaproteobacteria bacterium]|nr:response regulator [Deltaproteobacteria bacterium]